MTATTSTDLVNLTIDGVPVSVPKNTLVIRAAEEVGVQIPRFCDHPLLEPVGACRQCLVDVATPGPDGSLRAFPKPQASCTMTVSEGMEVKTQHTSKVADKAQQGVMELLLINHPLDCPVCDKGGECPLQNQALSNGRPKSRFEDVKRTYPKPINISSQVLLDRERCVLCARCTRFSDQIAGDPFIALVERGALQQIGIYQEKPFESYFSGNTVQICPVGALTGAAYRFRSRPFDLVSTPSVCEHCASGCATRTDHRRGSVLRRMAVNDPAVNEEWNCDKGRWAFTYATQADRITEPLVRDEDGSFRVASWPEALDVAARGLEAARDAKGVGVLVGGRVSGEDAYAYSKFARIALQTNDIDFRARPQSVEEAEFLAHHVVATGPGGGGVTYADLETAPTVVLVGFEPEDESPMVFLRLRKAFRKHGTRVFSVAPFATRGLEKLGGTLIRTAPGTEAEVLTALAEEKIEVVETSKALSTEGAVVLVGERLATVPGALSAAAALAKTTGARLAWVPRRAGERGALEAGALPNLLPGGRPVTDSAARAEVGEAWGVVGLPEAVGRDTAEMLSAVTAGNLAGLLVAGVDPADLSRSRDALDALARAFVVSLEVRESAVTERADVVLPVAPHAEKAGVFVDWEGRVRPFEAALDTNAMSDHRVLDLLADAMGEYLDVRTLAAARADMERLGPWSGARAAAPTVAPAEVPWTDSGQAVLATWHHLLDEGRMQDGEPFLAGTAPTAVARLSATTAAVAGVADGELLTVSTPTGAITVPAVITDMADHVVWLPTNSRGSAVRSTLGVDAGAVVTLTKGGAA
ncbi:NADH-quinone oxidoreductase subunit G [Oryzihumus leptocrescens]|uniref:NADH-quinone oxidoreductase subunit G n=1 Tax=Oryzihumus leptocrescens TaxID=297536 RepID=UPI0031D62806